MGLRAELLAELVREVLGPRGGLHEILDGLPTDEYLTGVLQPVDLRATEMESNVQELPGEDITGEEDLDDAEILPILSTPALDPRRRPSSMGLLFRVRASASGEPRLAICVSWARYFPIEDDPHGGEEERGKRRRSGRPGRRWRREPRCLVLDPVPSGTHHLGPRGPVPPGLAEISLHVHLDPDPDDPGAYSVRVHLVNRISPRDPERLQTEECIFQPQIRVVCLPGTSLETYRSGNRHRDPEERMLEFLYRDYPVMARGQLTSAVWRQIDPERPAPEDLEPGRPDSPPFVWVDGALLDGAERLRFSPPDVRTEFVPLYSIHTPDLGWDPEAGPEPELDAWKLAHAGSDPDGLRRIIEPLVTGYREWLGKRLQAAENMPGDDRDTAGQLLERCRDVLKRMEDGLSLLTSDPDVRLAFSFANQAMALQSEWAGRSLRWRPFQLAFLLMNLRSIADPKHPDREVCDLLWVPTGSGKTEAYLALAAFTIAFRRLRAMRRERGDRTGGGVAVLSRYTLRLLTIQQFRRALSMITACERLRVHGLKDGGPVGWRPKGWPDRRDFLWGSVPFRIGLWVGGNLTPNHLGIRRGGNGEIRSGALSILSGYRGEGEPAQVLNCPACGAILAIPDEGLPPGEHRLHLVIRRPSPRERMELQELVEEASRVPGVEARGFAVRLESVHALPGGTHLILTLLIRTKTQLQARELDAWWNGFLKGRLELASFRASRPGYFPVEAPRIRRKTEDGGRVVDFEIWCPSPQCPLAEEWWAEGVPTDSGTVRQLPHLREWLQNRGRDGKDAPRQFPLVADGQDAAGTTPDGMIFREIPKTWRVPPEPKPKYGMSWFLASRIPIPALTVDEQVYRRLPSMVVATVDKFARMPSQQEAGNLFGNVRGYRSHEGYQRDPPAAETFWHVAVEPMDPPDLILQDELHLIGGPLGSMVGIYETAVDLLCRRDGRPVKYVAATATIREASSQVQSLFTRRLQIFPPPGLSPDDRFFVRSRREPHPLQEREPGQLHVGLMAPGRGSLTPLVRIWACVLQNVWRFHLRNHPDSRFFLTPVGYFNAIRELAGTLALYRQDIPQRIHEAFRDPRTLNQDPLELSSRTPSTWLPAILDRLSGDRENPPEALLTTSMFGTGVDIPHLSLMIVHGQPKTTSAYIQATGRVGRRRGALVITFLRSTRPRDVSHYEFFCTYHRQLHRHVEPASVMPFSPGTMDLAIGPVLVTILRHHRDSPHPWYREESAGDMADRRLEPEVQALEHIVVERSALQPPERMPPREQVSRVVERSLDRWMWIARKNPDSLRYVEYAFESRPRFPVVLGDLSHQRANLPVVFENAPQSMREVEASVEFEVGSASRQSIRVSQMVFSLGPGAILESRNGPRIIPLEGLNLPQNISFENLEIPGLELQVLLRHLYPEASAQQPRVFWVPSSDEHPGIVWRTVPFPEWKFCVTHRILYRNQCPKCGEEGRANAGWVRHQTAIRFVMACPDGHLDDVDWDYVVHGTPPPHSSSYYEWLSHGSGLWDIHIRCPRCRRTVSLGWVYRQQWPCAGRFPEHELPGSSPHRPGCSRPALIIQRQASNLRIPVALSFFVLPPSSTRVHRIFQKVQNALIPEFVIPDGRLSRDALERILDRQVQLGLISDVERQEVLECPDEEIARAIRDIAGTGSQVNPDLPPEQLIRQLHLQEFHTFLKGASEGLPPVHLPYPRSRALLEIHPGQVREFPPFRVIPIQRLTAITVQVGYYRAVTSPLDPRARPVLVDVSVPDRKGSRWFPGYQAGGEGLLIVLGTDDGWDRGPDGEASRAWHRSMESGAGEPPNAMTGWMSRPSPAFVAWHTLSHFLIRTLEIDSGYSAASIRERIYLEERDGRTRGGILLYTVSGGSGTMGGLLALASRFDRILERVRGMVRICSADPLCWEQRFREGDVVGSACHGCCLISETSCEHRNFWLDRRVLLETGWL